MPAVRTEAEGTAGFSPGCTDWKDWNSSSEGMAGPVFRGEPETLPVPFATVCSP